MSTWNHRVIKDGNTLRFAEVHYNESGQPIIWGSPFMCSESMKGLRQLRRRLRQAERLPVLDGMTLKEVPQKDLLA